MKNTMFTQKVVFAVTTIVISSSLAQAANLNIEKDAETRAERQARCEKSQERTTSLIKLANERVKFENERAEYQQKHLEKLHGDDKTSYINVIVIDRSQAMTDIEGFRDKISKRIDLISSPNICSGIADNANGQLVSQLHEASRQLKVKDQWLAKNLEERNQWLQANVMPVSTSTSN